MLAFAKDTNLSQQKGMLPSKIFCHQGAEGVERFCIRGRSVLSMHGMVARAIHGGCADLHLERIGFSVASLLLLCDWEALGLLRDEFHSSQVEFEWSDVRYIVKCPSCLQIKIIFNVSQ